jgi:hypothetical protein
MQPAVESAQTVASGLKVATALDHIRNNRIEYLLVLIFSHFIGLTDTLITHASGVCV